MTPAVVAVATPGAAQLPMLEAKRPSEGICPIQAPIPMTRQSRPTATLRNARTTSGSNCDPAAATSSCPAAETVIGRLYVRGAVITS